jgi:hypothetical protein
MAAAEEVKDENEAMEGNEDSEKKKSVEQSTLQDEKATDATREERE